MDKVLMISGGVFYYWKPVILAIAALAAAVLAIGLRIWRGERLLPLAVALPVGTALSVYIARLIHWYCRFESYESLSSALSTLRGGGYSLIGVFVGMLIALALMRLFGLTRDLPSLLDCVSPAAALGIALGRLGDLFTAANRGKVIFADEALHRLPYASEVINSSSGAVEWRFATFAFQSLWCALLCLIFLTAALLPRRRQPCREAWGKGNIFLLFMVLYCCGQVVTDSTRYDALFLRSNGFVSLEQILCAVVIFAVLVLYSVRSILALRFRFWHPILWLAAMGGLGAAGYMEYYVQRHGNAYLFAYTIMALGLFVVFCVIFAMYRTGMLRAGGTGKAARAPDGAEDSPAPGTSAERSI